MDVSQRSCLNGLISTPEWARGTGSRSRRYLVHHVPKYQTYHSRMNSLKSLDVYTYCIVIYRVVLHEVNYFLFLGRRGPRRRRAIMKMVRSLWAPILPAFSRRTLTATSPPTPMGRARWSSGGWWTTSWRTWSQSPTAAPGATLNSAASIPCSECPLTAPTLPTPYQVISSKS